MRHWVMGLVLVLAGAMGISASGAPVQGTDYQALNPARPTSTPNKIVVTEFFSYQCPHCYQFSPILNSWVSKLPSDVVFERVPVSFGRPDWGSIAQAYFSLQAMDKLDAKMDTAIFAAIHEQRIKLTDLSSITDWVSKQGVNGKDFSDMYTSFGIGSKMKNAEQATVAYNISGVPTLIIDGKYTVLGNDHNVQLATADQLIEMVRAARGMPVPVTKQAASSSSSSSSGESKKTAHKPIAKASSAKDQSKRAG